MTPSTKKYAGALFLLLVTVETGGNFLFKVLERRVVIADPTQLAYFRAGHAHAGVILLLALVATLYLDHTGLGGRTRATVRVLLLAAPLLMSAGFFGSGLGVTDAALQGVARVALYSGAVALALALGSTSVGLFRSSPSA
jgi:hypothetical protein